MISYVIRRIAYLFVLLWVLTIIVFVIIQLPPGDYLSTVIMRLRASGAEVSESQIRSLEIMYGLNKPVYIQYFMWVWRMLHGDLGLSFQWNKPVAEVIGERIVLTMIISLLTIVFVYGVSIPIGVYSATHQYSASDHTFTFIGFIGLAIPNFFLALLLMYILFAYFGRSVAGLFSLEFKYAPWSLAKVQDMFKHLLVPIIVVGTASTAGLIRVMRGCLLDELHKQYVITARAKGITEKKLLFKYPVRMAINPIISTIGWILPTIISGEFVTAMVLNLPTTGPMLLDALMSEDMFLAGSFIMIVSSLTVTGTLLSDILLACLDPRIRYERRHHSK